jgi:aspartate carbamoyltransferase catalytic subunit
MHLLPRVSEIAWLSYEGIAYFRQAANGVPVRMALIALVTGGEVADSQKPDLPGASMLP